MEKRTSLLLHRTHTCTHLSERLKFCLWLFWFPCHPTLGSGCRGSAAARRALYGCHWVSSLPFTEHSVQMVSSIGDLSMLKKFAPYCEAAGNEIRPLNSRPSISILFSCERKDEVIDTLGGNEVLLDVGSAVPQRRGFALSFILLGH